MDKLRHSGMPDATREGVRYLFADERVERLHVCRRFDGPGFEVFAQIAGRVSSGSGVELEDALRKALEKALG